MKTVVQAEGAAVGVSQFKRRGEERIDEKVVDEKEGGLEEEPPRRSDQ